MKKNVINAVNVKSILVGVTAIVGGSLLTVGIYRGFLIDYSVWQRWFCQAMIEEYQMQGYMMASAGILCCTSATAYHFKNKIQTGFEKIKSLFKK